MVFPGESRPGHHRPEAPPPPKDPPPPEKPPPPKPPPPKPPPPKPPPPHLPPIGMIHGIADPRWPRLSERKAKNNHRPSMIATQANWLRSCGPAAPRFCALARRLKSSASP